MELLDLFAGINKRYQKPSHTLSIRMAANIFKELDELAYQTDETRSTIVKTALAYYMDSIKNKQS